MSEALRFEILGPQRAWYADRPLDLGAGKQRAVLAVLLLSAGRPVPTGQIIEAVWPDEPPANGLNVVQKYVAGLRRVLEPERSPRTPGRVLTLTDAGYLLRVQPESVDAVRFERGVHRARQRSTAGRTAEAQAELAAALELWQGEPFTGFAGPYFETARHRLVELRAVALETRVELDLASGRHRELVGELVELVAEFPVRERLRHQLMLALYRSGRQAEALAAYRDFDELLREEYGIEPGEVLQELHQRILRADPSLIPAPPAPVAVSPVPAVPPPPVAVPPPLVAGSPPLVAGPVSAAAVSPAPVSAARGRPAPVPPVAYLPPPVPAPRTAPTGLPRWASHLVAAAGAAVALCSFGVLTWLVLLLYAVRRGRGWLFAAAGGYLAAVVLFVAGLETMDADGNGLLSDVGFVALGGAWLGGAAHVIMLNPAVAGMFRSRAGRRAADDRRIRREQARYLLYHYPAAREQLHIGRPDLPRTFDDGGLVDINAVGEKVIVGLPGVTGPQARQVAMDRWLRGPFGSMEELAGRCLLPPALTDSLRDLLVFLPPVPGPARPDEPPPHPPAAQGG
ncbi:winged helix-turn-helix domain-containing protein [Micromonospora yasonensis]|uniref:BTAD domain-containing putative transcriptional regulator n=1 Tax=Micromonospora yasonensis TaxID=1128667 RepID=UPI002230754A|nr:BTAD domain-containing putative transcriptional regulator [Micromonospora yasonensis]MCW3842739.1 winged helix-turn-helix domain-containing protein [Micromonospora yasonensis]